MQLRQQLLPLLQLEAAAGIAMGEAPQQLQSFNGRGLRRTPSGERRMAVPELLKTISRQEAGLQGLGHAQVFERLLMQ
jgi:hypothetical protein